MEFRNQPIRKVPLCQTTATSSLSCHTRSLLVYNSRLKKKTTSHSHSHTEEANMLQSLKVYMDKRSRWLKTTNSYLHWDELPRDVQQQQQRQQGGPSRPWDEMPRDILLKIFNLLPFQHALQPFFYPLVCRSWLYAAVDIVYPPLTTVIDLRFLSAIPFDMVQQLRFMVYLKLVLDTRPQTQWTALYLPDKIGFSKDDFLYIAQRTPCLQYLDWPYCGEFYFRWHWEAISSWKNLKGIDLGYRIGENLLKWLPGSFAYYFKSLRSLRLVGRFGVEEVSDIIKALFPQLEYFSLQDSSLTMDAASLVVSEVVATNNINNSHQVGIQTLDLRHCAFISRHFGCMDSAVKQRLVKAEIHEKAAAAIKTYLRCEGLELCSQCKVKHPSLWHSFYLPQGRKQEEFTRSPQVLVKKKRKFFGSSSHQPPLGTTKRHKGPVSSSWGSWGENTGSWY